MTRSVALGIDVGTSAAKAVFVDPRARVIASGAAPYPVESPRPGWSQQRAASWWGGVVAAVHEALARAPAGVDVAAVGLSGQMHGCVLVDEGTLAAAPSGAIGALGPVLLWNDQRTGPQCRAIHERVGGRARLVEAVGNAALPGFTLPKLLWLAEHRPQEVARAARLLLPKDFIALQLTGRPATDVGDASGTLLFDARARRWRDDLAELFDLRRGLLPDVLESAQVVGPLTPWAAAALGLRPGTPVAIGSGDNQTAAIGAGVTEPGHALAILGTSGVVYAPSASPRIDLAGQGRVQSGYDGTGRDRPGGWCNTGCMLSAGGALAWARSVLNAPIERLLEEADATPTGADGLLFAPYLTGERCPHADPDLRGGWIGLTSAHGRGHLVRAVLEGVAMSMTQIVELIRAIGVPVESLRVTGGGARSPLWRRILADAVGVPVETPMSQEGSALGAALLGAVAAGMHADVRSASALVGPEDRIDPGPGRDIYADLRPAYDRLYATLKPPSGGAGAEPCP